ALLTLALKYSSDKRPEQDKRYGEAYSVLASGRVHLGKELIPVFEKHLKEGGDKAALAARALASIGLPAKAALIKLLNAENREVALNAADGLSWMSFDARRFRNEKVEDPVSADEVFPTLLRILRGKDRQFDSRV